MDTVSRFMRVVILIAMLFLAAVAVPMGVFDSKGIERVDLLRKELRTLVEANQRIRYENNALRQEIRAFHSDPGYIEKVARDEFGMIVKDEVIYQFPEEP